MMKNKHLLRLREIVRDKRFQFFDFFYNRRLRKKLRNHDFTILSSNCIGGIVYHRLGEKFCSPTINLWMYEHDFQKFCLNLPYYADCELRFYSGERSYPLAKIGKDDMEVTVHFLHYKSEEEAEAKWTERIRRIDENNLFVIASDNGHMLKEDLEKWKNMKCKNLVIFTASAYPDLAYTFQLKRYAGRECVGKYLNDTNKITGLRYVERVFDFCEFLNK